MILDSMRISVVEKFAVGAGILWLFTVLDSFFIWNSYENFLKVFAGGVVVIASFFLYNRKKMIFTIPRVWLMFSSFLFFIYLNFRIDIGIWGILARFFAVFPFMLLVFWKNDTLNNLYLIFRKIIIFFAIGSILITLFFVTGLIQYIPYYVVEARSNVHELADLNYHIYGCFVTIHSYISSMIPRACGPLQEPGHFAIILGFVFLIDRFLKQKVNIGIVVCGILTFSMNFFVLAVLGEIYDFVYNKAGLRKLWIYISILFMTFLMFLFLSKELQEQLIYLFYERNLERVFEAYQSTNSLSNALDERINQTGAFYYEQFLHSSKLLFGFGTTNDEIVLSDYRGMLLRLGYIGFFLSLLWAYTSLLNAPFRLRICLIGAMILIYLHRAWMMQQPYIYFLVFLAVCVYNYHLSHRMNELK